MGCTVSASQLATSNDQNEETLDKQVFEPKLEKHFDTVNILVDGYMRQIASNMLVPHELYGLVTLFYNIKYKGITHSFVSSAYQCIIQILFMTPQVREIIFEWKYDHVHDDKASIEHKYDRFMIELQKVFTNLYDSNHQDPCNITSFIKLFVEDGWINDYEINDVYLRGLIQIFYDVLINTNPNNTQYTKDLFEIILRDYNEQKTFEFIELELKVKRINNVESAIEILMETSKFKRLPEILIVRLKRFEFDFNIMAKKRLSNNVEIPFILNMIQYIEDDEELMYELYGMIVHVGSSYGGYFISYIKSFETNKWYQFDDRLVTEINDMDTCIKQYFGGAKCGYILFYKR